MTYSLTITEVSAKRRDAEASSVSRFVVHLHLLDILRNEVDGLHQEAEHGHDDGKHHALRAGGAQGDGGILQCGEGWCL